MWTSVQSSFAAADCHEPTTPVPSHPATATAQHQTTAWTAPSILLVKPSPSSTFQVRCHQRSIHTITPARCHKLVSSMGATATPASHSTAGRLLHFLLLAKKCYTRRVQQLQRSWRKSSRTLRCLLRELECRRFSSRFACLENDQKSLEL